MGVQEFQGKENLLTELKPKMERQETTWPGKSLPTCSFPRNMAFSRKFSLNSPFQLHECAKRNIGSMFYSPFSCAPEIGTLAAAFARIAASFDPFVIITRSSSLFFNFGNLFLLSLSWSELSWFIEDDFDDDLTPTSSGTPSRGNNWPLAIYVIILGNESKVTWDKGA